MNMSCGARTLRNDEISTELPSLLSLTINEPNVTDVSLNLKLLNKYLEVKSVDETLAHRRNEYRLRKEHLQKRRDALHEREIMFKERIISYEMYIKELAMKRDRSLRRIDDEKALMESKRIELESLNKDIEQMQEENTRLQNIIGRYQPHCNLLTQVVDRTDRFHSVDGMIEKFDMLYASYQDILATIKNSNEELNDVQRRLVLTVERKNHRISSMNSRIHELQQNHIDIQQRIQNVQTEIENYQRGSTERQSEVGAIRIAIESMFALVKRYSHRIRRKDLTSNEPPLVRLKQIDTFLGDLIYYVDHVNNKSEKLMQNQPSLGEDASKIQREAVAQQMKDDDGRENSHWRSSCEIDRRKMLVESTGEHEQSSYCSYKIRGEDNRLYTITVNTDHPTNASQARRSLPPNNSSLSMSSRSNETRRSVLKASTTDKRLLPLDN